MVNSGERLAFALLLLLSLTACALVGLPSEGTTACPAALLEGTLASDADLGLVVRHDDRLLPNYVVEWPNGWAVRDVGDERELLDTSGAAVAREGDRMSAGGGFYPPDDRFRPCGDITFTPAP